MSVVLKQCPYRGFNRLPFLSVLFKVYKNNLVCHVLSDLSPSFPQPSPSISIHFDTFNTLFNHEVGLDRIRIILLPKEY